MENVTHVLLGAALGETATLTYASRYKIKPEKIRQRFWIVSILANNLPDLDMLYAGWISGPMGYLLHHRGHTHTLLGSLFLSLLLYAGAHFFIQKKKKVWQAREKFWIAALCVFGPWVHVLADSWNSYGVHPFWPFSNRWFYGDSIFIFEPLLWVFLGSSFVWIFEGKKTRYGFLFFPVCAVFLSLFSGYVPIKVSFVILLLAFWLLGLYFILKPVWRNILCWVSLVVLLGVFFLGSQTTKQVVTEEVASQFSNTKMVDIAVSPSPANPLCYQFITVEVLGSEYVSRKGIFALLPRWISAAECMEYSFWVSEQKLSKEEIPLALSRPYLLWVKEYHGSLTELQRLETEDCTGSAFLKWSRIPAWRSGSTANNQTQRYQFWDLRFARFGTRSFSTVQSELGACPRFVPNWQTPLGLYLNF